MTQTYTFSELLELSKQRDNNEELIKNIKNEKRRFYSYMNIDEFSKQVVDKVLHAVHSSTFFSGIFPISLGNITVETVFNNDWGIYIVSHLTIDLSAKNFNVTTVDMTGRQFDTPTEQDIDLFTTETSHVPEFKHNINQYADRIIDEFIGNDIAEAFKGIIHDTLDDILDTIEDDFRYGSDYSLESDSEYSQLADYLGLLYDENGHRVA